MLENQYAFSAFIPLKKLLRLNYRYDTICDLYCWKAYAYNMCLWGLTFATVIFLDCRGSQWVGSEDEPARCELPVSSALSDFPLPGQAAFSIHLGLVQEGKQHVCFSLSFYCCCCLFFKYNYKLQVLVCSLKVHNSMIKTVGSSSMFYYFYLFIWVLL
jgi:hypothetical protein